MPGAFFVQATLDQTDFTGTTLDGADRTEAANFSYACLSNCDFTGAGLYAVICTGATLIELTLSGGVNLQQADFSDAYLPNTVFTHAACRARSSMAPASVRMQPDERRPERQPPKAPSRPRWVPPACKASL